MASASTRQQFGTLDRPRIPVRSSSSTLSQRAAASTSNRSMFGSPPAVASERRGSLYNEGFTARPSPHYSDPYPTPLSSTNGSSSLAFRGMGAPMSSSSSSAFYEARTSTSQPRSAAFASSAATSSYFSGSGSTDPSQSVFAPGARSSRVFPPPPPQSATATGTRLAASGAEYSPPSTRTSLSPARPASSYSTGYQSKFLYAFDEGAQYGEEALRGVVPPIMPPSRQESTRRSEPSADTATSSTFFTSSSSGSSNSGSPQRKLDQPFGLPNLGNTCYMNAVLQCILNLKNFIADVAKEAAVPRKTPVKNVLVELAKGVGGTLQRSALLELKTLIGKRNNEFSSYDQADGHEFLRTLLVSLHDELNRRSFRQSYEELKDDSRETPDQTASRWLQYHKSRDDSVVYDRFGGSFKAVTQCDRCNYPSLAFDPFLDVQLAFPRDASKTEFIPLTEMFQNLLEVEVIDAKQQWTCSRCKRRSSARRSQVMFGYPKTLVWHLKRFNSRGQKNETKVLFAEKLRLQDSTIMYSLCGVVCHSGTALMGHYTSFVKINSTWFRCDDSVITEVHPSSVLNVPTAYVLFYDSLP